MNHKRVEILKILSLEELSMKQILIKTRQSESGATSIVKNFEKEGIVYKQKKKKDNTRPYVLTAKGRFIIRNVRGIEGMLETSFMKNIYLDTGWSDTEMLKKLNDVIEREERNGNGFYDIKFNPQGEGCLILFKNGMR